MIPFALAAAVLVGLGRAGSPSLGTALALSNASGQSPEPVQETTESAHGSTAATPPGALAEPASTAPASTAPASTIRVASYQRTTLIPKTCGWEDESYDLLIHFHGVETTVIPAFEKSGLNAVLAIINLGEFSGPYEKKFADPGSLTALLNDIQRTVAKRCPAARMGKIALSSWSGGYGAVSRILAHPAEAEKVDAVLLADGLHAKFSNVRTRSVNELQMTPFLRFSKLAALGDRLLAITHTAINTPYASTTETADYLLHANGMERTAHHQPGPRAGMTLTSSAGYNSLLVEGYEGDGKRDHCNHLFAIGDTLFPVLRQRWITGRVAVSPSGTTRDVASHQAPSQNVVLSAPERSLLSGSSGLFAATATIAPLARRYWSPTEPSSVALRGQQPVDPRREPRSPFNTLVLPAAIVTTRERTA
jgi:hypothetical protein